MLPARSAAWQGSYPEVSQLQGDLHKGVRAGPALLDEAFAKGQELEAVQLHVVCQCLGHLVGTLDDCLALFRHGKGQLGAELSKQDFRVMSRRPEVWVTDEGQGWGASVYPQHFRRRGHKGQPEGHQPPKARLGFVGRREVLTGAAWS